MTMNEIIALGIVLNDINSNVSKISFADKVQSTVSFIGNAADEKGVALDSITSVQVAGALKRIWVIGKYSMRHLNCCASLGWTFAQSERRLVFFEKVCEEGSKLSLTHASSELLLSLPDDEFSFIIRCLQAHLHLRAVSGDKTGRFDDMRKHLFRCAIEMFRICAKIGAKKNIRTNEVFQSKLVLRKHDVPVLEHMMTQASKL